MIIYRKTMQNIYSNARTITEIVVETISENISLLKMWNLYYINFITSSLLQ